MSVPTDYTRTQFVDTAMKTTNFNLEVIDPCTETSLNAWSADDVTINAMGDSVTINVAASDSVSSSLGDGDGQSFCGSRKIDISPSSAYSYASSDYENG